MLFELQVVSKYLGESEAKVRELFDFGPNADDGLINLVILDELDALVRSDVSFDIISDALTKGFSSPPLQLNLMRWILLFLVRSTDREVAGGVMQQTLFMMESRTLFLQ